jgi:hypothetical protein
MCAGCATSADPPKRFLPAVQILVPPPVPVPRNHKEGQDAKSALAEMKAVAEENARRLQTARRLVNQTKTDFEAPR